MVLFFKVYRMTKAANLAAIAVEILFFFQKKRLKRKAGKWIKKCGMFGLKIKKLSFFIRKLSTSSINIFSSTPTYFCNNVIGL